MLLHRTFLILGMDIKKGPLGIFDSGLGGLTILKDILAQFPTSDTIYLGDNARAPYGTRSFETIYEYTLQSVKWLLQQDCPLIVLACNTASARALRTIQQKDLPSLAPNRRVLGIVRPTSEVIGTYSKSGHIGILATKGTVLSESYLIEIKKFFPQLIVNQLPCPMWVPLIENGEFQDPGADYFVKKYIEQLLSQDPKIDTVLLACTHYPMLYPKIRQFLPSHIKIVKQGELVTDSLVDYLHRHQPIADAITQNGTHQFFTTDDPETFDVSGSVFLEQKIHSNHLLLS